jgi:hypothetical protein
MKNKLIIWSGIVLGSAPFMALAATPVGTAPVCTSTVDGTTLGGFLCTASRLLNQVIPVLVILGVVYFIWGVITYVISSDEEAKKSGRNRIIYGLIGLAVIVSLWGLVGVLTKTFGVIDATGITIPTVNY